MNILEIIGLIAFITLFVLSGAFIKVECWLQFFLKKKIRDAKHGDVDIWYMLLYSSKILRQPNKDISFRLYGLNTQLLFSADFHLNNMGFFSDHDYRYERGPHEFRIVVIGGEQTASSVANRVWPDYLEDELNKRDHSVHYKVFNIAWPDAGPEHYIKYWQDEGAKFFPDLVILNYVESDFFRPVDGVAWRYHGQPIGYSLIEYRVGPGEDDIAAAITANSAGNPVTSFADPHAIPSHPYQFFVSQKFINDPIRIKRLQEQVVSDMIAGVIPPPVRELNPKHVTNSLEGHHKAGSYVPCFLPLINPATIFRCHTIPTARQG